MKTSKRFIWLRVISCLASIVSLSAGSFLLGHNSFSKKTAALNVFQNEFKQENADYCFANIHINESENNNIHEQIFLDTYSDNFSKTSTKILSVSDNNGIANFETTFNGLQIPYETSVVSGINYSNSKEMVRFETICINLLLYRERQIEHNYNQNLYDGFIYIPDYYADYLLENSLAIGSTYLDLLENESNNVIVLSKGDKGFRYKIANIFHVSGFKEQYAGGIDVFYNDYDTGDKLNTLFNGFCFVSNYNHFVELDEDLFTSIVFEFEPKKYELDEFLTLVSNYKNFYNSNKGSASFYYHSANGLKEYSNSTYLFNAYFYGANLSWHVFIGTLLFLATLFIAFFSYFELFGLKRDVFLLILLLLVSIMFMVVSFVSKKIFILSIDLYLLFNPFSSIACIITLLGLIAIICLAKFGKQEKYYVN